MNQFYNTRNPADLWLNVADFKKVLLICVPLWTISFITAWRGLKYAIKSELCFTLLIFYHQSLMLVDSARCFPRLHPFGYKVFRVQWMGFTFFIIPRNGNFWAIESIHYRLVLKLKLEITSIWSYALKNWFVSLPLENSLHFIRKFALNFVSYILLVPVLT